MKQFRSKILHPGMIPPDKFNGENSLKLQGFLQSCKLLFSNDPTVFSDDRKKVLYAALYLGGRASQCFEPNSSQNYMLFDQTSTYPF
ncbi:uncharacterized protein VP01_4893g1 [Puccinia sorghi]|uniref:DUF4939 domain-containing protein n=1 Tax=Puccinia sorghi TaxID=27349 RepID=A0A0L6UM71_9BASI|nr:uncharacterized protein VP01_4893g1 [Puccinia sorghi]